LLLLLLLHAALQMTYRSDEYSKHARTHAIEIRRTEPQLSAGVQQCKDTTDINWPARV
jgi:hypothetical protein